jgi:hypothetical protein
VNQIRGFYNQTIDNLKKNLTTHLDGRMRTVGENFSKRRPRNDEDDETMRTIHRKEL